MWDTIVTLIEKTWKERPRKNLLSSVLQLRRTMKACQDWYDQYQAILAEGKDADPNPIPKAEWIRSLTDLPECILKVDEVLEIFSRETHKAIHDYSMLESLEMSADLSFDVLEKDLKASRDFDLGTNTLQPTFRKALDKLDEFIQLNFKPEEILAANRLL